MNGSGILILGGNIPHDPGLVSGDEFVMTATAVAPVISIISGETAIAAIDQNGQGRLAVRLDNDVVPVIDTTSHGRIIFLHDLDSGEFWSVGLGSTEQQSERSQTRHGFGYTTIETTVAGIDVAWTIFIPMASPLEIWQVTIKNQGEKKRRLSVFWVVDFALDTELPVYTTKFAQNTISLHSRLNDVVRFLGLSKEVNSFETVRSAFLGTGQSWQQPTAVQEGKCARTLCQGDVPVGVLQKNITLGPKVEQKVEVFVGAYNAKNKTSAATKVTAPLIKADAISKAFEQVVAGYQTNLQHNRLRGINGFDHHYNGWLSYQNLVSHHFAEEKIGVATITTTSLARAIRAGLVFDSATAVRQLTAALGMVMKDGRVASAWGNNSVELDNLGDPADSLCLAKLIIEVVKETGDHGWLSHSLPYYDGSHGSILEHLTRLTELVLSHLHGHVVVVDGQELTALSAETVGLLKELVALHVHHNDHHQGQRYQQLTEAITAAINKRFWVGPFYAAGRDESGRLPTKNQPRFFDLATQIAAITNGVASEKAVRIIAALKKQHGLNCPNFWPPYDQVTSNSHSLALPGCGQNGSLDLALLTELAQTAATNNEADYGWRLIERVVEPFWQSEFLNHDQGFSPQPLDGKFGRAEIVTKVVRETILGIQPTLNGLKIDPHFPPSWRHVEISRRYRNADYHIRIQNPLRVTHGVDRIVVDGIRIVGNVIRPFSTGVHFVEVVMG